MQFLAYVQNQANRTLKVLHTDQGGEFTSMSSLIIARVQGFEKNFQ